MAKIEFVQSVTEEKHVLDVYQQQIIGKFESLALEENIYKYLSLRNRNGNSFWIEYKNGKARFTGCDPDNLGFNGLQSIHEQYEWYVIDMVKQMLDDWHTKKQYATGIRRYGWRYLLCTCEHHPTTGIELNKKQRGTLTAMLKMEKRRKGLYK